MPAKVEEASKGRREDSTQPSKTQQGPQSQPSRSRPGLFSRLTAGFYAGVALVALVLSFIHLIRSSTVAPILSFVPNFPIPSYLSHTSGSPAKTTASSSTETQTSEPRPILGSTQDTEPIDAAAFACDEAHPYRTEIISTSPLVIYIHSFVSASEAAALVRAGEALFAPSRVDQPGGSPHAYRQRTADRTSSSAGLPPDDPAVECVLRRARRLLGPGLFRDGWDDMGPPQLVRYTAGQRFNLHSDWWGTPRAARDGSGRGWNRVASFFVGLQDGCTGGETYFPFVEPASDPREAGTARNAGGAGTAETEEQEMMRRWTGKEPVWRRHPRGGVAFRPVAGNAVFWVNLHANGTGDVRTKHAGLPIGEGLKTAMNIWPRQYYPE